jgi:AraC-like DNA-binding protein
MVPLTLRILHSKYFTLPAALATLVVASIVIYYASITDKVIFPDLKNYRCDYYTDAPNGGNTQVIDYVVADSIISLGFQLGNGFYSPYAGVKLLPLDNQPIDAGKYNQISIRLKGVNMDRVGIAIYTPPLNINGYNSNDETLYHSYLNITNQPQTYHLPLSQFQHPDWWEDMHHIPKNQQNKFDLNNILHVNIGSAFSSIIDNKKSLEIQSIAFTRDNREIYFWMSIIYILFITTLFAISYLIYFLHHKASHITVSYQPINVPQQSKGDEKCIEYINTHYHDSNLTLEKISEETATSARRITFLIHDKFNCNFKTYLNRIRINESKTLLSQTDLNIGEIAFKVGFNNQSHFNRVFKTECQISPTEFREKTKK